MQNADFIEQAVYGAKRADRTAEGPLAQYEKYKKSCKNTELYCKKRAGQFPQVGIHCRKRNACLKRARGAELAEPWLAGNPGHGANKADEYDIAQPFEHAGYGQLGRVDHMQQVLQQAKRAGPAADDAASTTSDQPEKAQHVKWYMIGPIGYDQLQRADWTGKQRGRAGVAVEAGAGQQLQASLVNAADIKSVEIKVEYD